MGWESYKKKKRIPNTVRSKSRCALRLWCVDLAVSIEVAVEVCPRTLNELKPSITAFIRNISQADLQKVSANKIKRVLACIDARGHHFQHLW
jgi:hypothetical protein